MARTIELIEEILAYSDPDNPWIKLYYDKVRFSGGREGRYNRLIEGGGGFPGVVILPVFRNEIGMDRVFRYPVNEEMWEIPRGYAESTDAVREALRELSEETKIVLTPEDICPIGSIHPNSGILSTWALIYRANCSADDKKKSVEKGTLSWFNELQVNKMIVDDLITDAFTLTAILKSRILFPN